MANVQDVYQRKISGEEAQGQYILIVKNGLTLFPKPGKLFTLLIQGAKETVKAELTLTNVPRWSVGPNKAQQLYRIDMREYRSVYPLHFGKKIMLTKTSENEYTLS